MNLVHQLLLLSLSAYLDDVTAVSSSRDVSESSQKTSSDQTAIQPRRNSGKNHQLITDESEDIRYARSQPRGSKARKEVYKSKARKEVYKSKALKEVYKKHAKRKFSAKTKGTATPTNISAVSRKKKKRRKKKKNDTEIHYYDVLSQSNEDWMKFISPEVLEKYEDHRNGSNTITNDELFTDPIIDIGKLKRKFLRRLNKTRRTTTRAMPHRLKRRTTKQRNRQDDGSDGTVSRLDDVSNRESKKEIVDDEGSDIITHRSLKAKIRSTETEPMENWKSERREPSHRITRVRNTVEPCKNFETSHDFYSEETERKTRSPKKTSSKRERKLRKYERYSDSHESKNRVSREKFVTYDSTRKRRDKFSDISRNRGRRRPRAVADDQLSSSDDSNDSEDLSTKSSQLKNTKDKNRNFNINEQRKITTRKTKKQRTLSIHEAKQRRLDKKMKAKTTRAPDPEFIAQQKKELKKVLQIPSNELNQDELIAKPNISTVYAVDPGKIDDITNLLESINGSQNEKLFLDLMKDLEETGTVQNKLYRDIEIEKSKLKLSTLEPTKDLKTMANTEEQETSSQTNTVKTMTTLVVKTKRTKAQTTFPVYVEGYDFSAERKTTISQKQTKKVLRYTSTTRKKSIHELMGITRQPLSSNEVLNTQEKKEFLHDVYFDYGNKRGPVELDILVTSTPKPKLKSSHLKIVRLITTDINEIENLKMKKKNFDLQHMLGSHADYYDNMKKIMDEKTIGKDTQERLMEEILIEKHGKYLTDKYREVGTTENVQNKKKEDKKSATVNFTHTTPTTSHIKHEESDTSKDSCITAKHTEYYFPADNPIFNIPLPNVNVSNPKKDEIENEIEKYNRQLIGEQEEAPEKLGKEEFTDDTSTMEQNSQYQKILEHYLVNEKSGQNPISDYVKQNKNTTRKIQNSKNVTDEQTEQENSLKIETKENNKEPQDNLQKAEIHSFLQNQLKSSTPTNLKESEENSGDIVKKELREEIMKNAHPAYEEVKLSYENEADEEALSDELNEYSKQRDKNEKLVTTKVSPNFTKSTTNLKRKKNTVEYTSLATPSSKELEEMMKNKDAHFEKMLGDYMKQHTEQTRREILRGRSTKIYSSTTPRSKDIEWDTTKNHCPAFLNQTIFDAECQKFIRIINKRGESQLQRLDFEMKTKNNPMIGKLLGLNLLTANNFADIVKRTIKKPCDLASDILYKQIAPSVLDAQAVAKYKDLSGNIISKCGYFIDDKYPFLAVTPDGLIDDEGMVKFLNTSTYPNVNMRMLFLRDKNLRSNFIVDKNISLSPEGSLMYEIQGALHVAKRQFCDLFVYNGNDHLLLKVQRKKDFWKSHMRKQLIDFYRQHMLPAIVKRLLHRRYKINPQENYLLNSEEDLLSVIRGLKSDTTQQTLPTRPIEVTKIDDHQVKSQEKIFDSRKFEEEEWENLHKKTVQIPILGRTRSINKEKSIRRKVDSKQKDSGEGKKILKSTRDSEYRKKKQKNRSEIENSSEIFDGSCLKNSRTDENSKRKILVKDKTHQKSERKSSLSRENKKRNKYASLQSLYESQEQHRKKIEKIKKTASLSTEKKRVRYISKSNLKDERTKTRKHKKDYKDSSVDISLDERKEKKIKRKHTSRIKEKKYVNKDNIARNLEKNKNPGRKFIVKSSETQSDSSDETSEDSHQQETTRRLNLKKKIRKKIELSDTSESNSKSKIRERKKKRIIREVQEARENVIRGRRIRRDYVALPEKEQTSSGDRVTIENLYSYKDTEYVQDSYDPNESLFRSLPNHVAKKKAEPDFLVDFYKKGLISKDEFLDIVKNKTREGKQWRRMPSVESSKTFETENYSDLVKLMKKEPLSGIKASVTEDPVEYDKDDICKKYMRNIGYGKPIDETLFNKSIVFTADELKRIKQEKIEAKFARAKAKRKILKRKNLKVEKSLEKTKEGNKRKWLKIKGKRISNETLSVADLSLGEEDSDEVTKQKGRWKTSPRFDMYNKSQRAERRRGFRREYRLYWENLSKLKRLYPSAESVNPDVKQSDRFYRGLKVAGVKTMSWEYTSMRECFHSYSTEFQEERNKRKEILKRVYADENTAEILQRLGRRLARKKQLEKNKTRSRSQDQLLEFVKKELIKRIPRNTTKEQVVKSVRRRKRSASKEMNSNQSLVDESGDSNTTDLKQESVETALKRAQNEEDNIAAGKTTFTYTTGKEDRDFSREKRRRAKILKQRPKYADRSSSSIEFILLQKELKKNGDNFSYLSVSITVEGMTNDKSIAQDPKSFYITKPMGITMNDQDALLNILKEKSEEDKHVNTNKENLGATEHLNKDDIRKVESTKNIELTKIQNHDQGNTFYDNQLSTKQTKKRGRPPKQTNSTMVKGKRKKATTINVRRKRSLDESRNRRKRKLVSKSSSKSSRASRSSQIDVKRQRRREKDQAVSKGINRIKNKKRAGKIKTHYQSTIESSSESEEDSKSTEESSSLKRGISQKNRSYKYNGKKQKLSSKNVQNRKKSERPKVKGSKEKTEIKKQISTEENKSESSASSKRYNRKKRIEKRDSVSENSSEELEKRKVKKLKDVYVKKSTRERTGKSFLRKEKRKQSERVTKSSEISKETLGSLSKEIKKRKQRVEDKKIYHKDLKSSESFQKESSSGTRSTDETNSSESCASKSQTKAKKSKKEMKKLKAEYRAEQRKLRRKRKKLLKKKLKRANTTVTQISKTTLKNKRTNSNNPILQDPDEPYTPATIVVRFTKDPRKYKKLPTRDVESIFDHKVDRYEDFIREYNFRHSCTPLGKKAIKKLEIIKEREFNQKQANRSEHGVLSKPGFDSYDSDDFDNNLERKHKPWEESVDEKPTETSKKLKDKIGKKMPWDYKDEYTNELSNDDRKGRSKKTLKKYQVDESSINKNINKHKKAKRKHQSASEHLIRETQKHKKGNEQVKDEESRERRRSKSSYTKEHDTKETQNSSVKMRKTHKSHDRKRTNMHEKFKKQNYDKKTEKNTGCKSLDSSEYETKGLEKHLIKMQAQHQEVTEKPCTTYESKHNSQTSGSFTSVEKVSHSKDNNQEDVTPLGSVSDYSGEYSADLSEGPDEPDESASKIRREFWKMQEVRETRKPPKSEISAERTYESDSEITEGTTSLTAHRIQKTDRHKKPHQSKVLKRDKRTPQETTDANVINMNPLLMMTGLSAETTKKKRRKTTWFRREKTPWRSQEITTTTLAPLVKRLRKKLEQIQSNANRFIVNKVKNYTSVLEAKGLWHLWVSPNSTYTTPTPAINREINLDFTVYQVTDIDVYNQIAAKLIRDQGVPNKRKSQFRHSRQFFELLMSTTPDPAKLIIPKEMNVYWKQKEDLDMFLYRGQRDGRNRPGTILYQKRMAVGKRWRLLAARGSGKTPVADEEGRTRMMRERGEKREKKRKVETEEG